MLDNSGIEFASVRHVKTGMLGAGGELPAGWSSEQFSSVEIVSLEHGERGPGLTLRLKFNAEMESDYVSLSAGPFRAGAPDDVFIFSTYLKLDEVENIESGFAIIREWQVNGPFVSQATHEFPISQTETRAVAGFQLKNNHRALQPVIAFKRRKREAGQCVLHLRRTALANLYDCPGLLSP